MKYYADLHIHTGLSPCADKDMTPNNIVNMAIIKGLDFIAITDHNSVDNLQPVIECAQDKDLIIIPGMEIESSEEVHILCLFSDLERAKDMGKIAYSHLPYIKNRSDIFGAQEKYDSNDEIIGIEDKMLVTATTLSISRIKEETENLGGLIIPAHIDRSSFSIISNLGFIPEELNLSTIEISKKADKEELIVQNPEISRYKIIANSDAHYLYDISERDIGIDLEEKSRYALLNYLKLKK